MMDANNQEVGQKAVRTNEFGSFTVDFALPSACLNGMFSLKAGEGRTNIRVEDYKRPTFDITFDKQQGSYQLGDKVEVKGKIQSYSGVLLQDLPVKYTVKRSVVDLWRLAESTQIASGEVIANEDGEFTIPVFLEENNAYKNNTRIYYRYSIEATATNVAGETQSSADVIAAGNRSLILQTELKEKTCKNQPFNTVFKVQNLNGQPVEVKGTFSLYQAKDADFKQLDENPAATGTFTSNEEMTIEWGNLPSGPYVLKAVVKNRPLIGVMVATIGSMLYITGSNQIRSYVFKEYYGNTSAMTLLSLASVPIIIICFPLVPKLVAKFGKKTTLMFGVISSTVLSVIIFAVKIPNVYVYSVLNVLAMIGQTVFTMLIWALVTDWLDYSEWKFHERSDGSMYSLYTFSRKIGSTIASAGVSFGLQAIGYISGNNVVQSDATINNIYMLVALIPVLTCVLELIGIGAIFNLDKEQTKEMYAELKQRRE